MQGTEACWCHFFFFRFANFKVGKINFNVGKINFLKLVKSTLKLVKSTLKLEKSTFNIEKSIYCTWCMLVMLGVYVDYTGS